MNHGALRVALRVGVPLLALLAAIVAGTVFGLSVTLLLLAFLALLLVIMLLQRSLVNLQADDHVSLEEALTLAAPIAEEEQKRAVLRALKDLEYERSVGKISEDDYAELSARYRAEAKRLIQSVDDELREERAKVEESLTKRQARKGGKGERHGGPKEHKSATPEAEPVSKTSSKLRSGASSKAATEGETESETKRSCPKCQRENDLDALFCKSCGNALKSEHEVLCDHCPSVYADTEVVCPACGASRPDEANTDSASVGKT